MLISHRDRADQHRTHTAWPYPKTVPTNAKNLHTLIVYQGVCRHCSNCIICEATVSQDLACDSVAMG